MLFIVNPDSPDEYDGLIDAAGREQLEITVRKSSEAFNSLADLQGFDTVVLANVPRVPAVARWRREHQRLHRRASEAAGRQYREHGLRARR